MALWAIQEGGDSDTRRLLPRWMGQIIELNVCTFVTELGQWKSKIEKRHAQGKELTKTQQLAYDAWLMKNVQKMIFSKGSKALITNAKKVDGNCIMVELHLSEDPESLLLKCTNGKIYRLVLLKQAASEHHETVLPKIFDGMVPEQAIMELEENKAEMEDEENEGEHQHKEQELQKALLDAGAPFESEDEGEMLLVDTDDVQDFHLESQKVCRVKTFNTRSSWVELSELGLTSLPRHVRGCSVGCHLSTCQWQGYYPQTTKGLSFSWGGRTNRSEKESLLKVICGVLSAHVGQNPRDSMWKSQLEKVQTALAKGL